jgi:2,4-dienoyl-CoA reductase-like NADH-dependent reductase (Old Yellow Enzyme family)
MSRQGSDGSSPAAQPVFQVRLAVGIAPWKGSGMAFPALLSEVRLGPALLRNRVVSTAHQTGLVHDHLPTDDLVAYHEARARGGVGAVFVEATATHESGLLTAHTIGGYLPAITGAYERLGAAVRGHGARLFVQLLHGGREQIADPPLPPAIGPSAVPTPRFHAEPRALTQAEIDDIVEGYATSARLAREGGIDGIELSLAHGYLAAQFFAPSINTRDDAYNGDLEARLRFARELIAAVRDAAGDGVAVGVRLAADEITPDGFGPEACAEIAAALCAGGGIDFVSAALGHSSTYRGSTYIVPPPPEPREAIAGPVAHMRAAIPGVPLIGTSRIADLDAAERLVGAGAVDLVGMTRAMIADPDLLAKAASGRADDVIPCIGCNQGCIGHYHLGLPIGCVVNPRTGRERSLPRPSRDDAAAGARRVLVVGGGPAGVAAALEAAESGHPVVLVERSESLGGQFRVAGRAPAHRETWERYSAWIARRLSAGGVEVRLGVEATAGDADGFDAVVLATGAVPYRPPLPDPMPCAVVDAPAAIVDPGAVRGPVLVADWGGGWAGLDAAETLAEAGHDVTYACAAAAIGEGVHQYQRNLYLARLDRLPVRLLQHMEIVGAGGAAMLRHVFSGRVEPLPPGLGTVVLAQGRVPDDALWGALESSGRCVRAGDVLGPRSAEEAVLEGTLAARRAVAPGRGAGRPGDRLSAPPPPPAPAPPSPAPAAAPR